MYKIFFYQDGRGKEPVYEYLKELSKRKDKDSRIKLNKYNDYIHISPKEPRIRDAEHLTQGKIRCLLLGSGPKHFSSTSIKMKGLCSIHYTNSLSLCLNGVTYFNSQSHYTFSWLYGRRLASAVAEMYGAESS